MAQGCVPRPPSSRTPSIMNEDNNCVVYASLRGVQEPQPAASYRYLLFKGESASKPMWTGEFELDVQGGLWKNDGARVQLGPPKAVCKPREAICHILNTFFKLSYIEEKWNIRCEGPCCNGRGKALNKPLDQIRPSAIKDLFEHLGSKSKAFIPHEPSLAVLPSHADLVGPYPQQAGCEGTGEQVGPEGLQNAAASGPSQGQDHDMVGPPLGAGAAGAERRPETQSPIAGLHTRLLAVLYNVADVEGASDKEQMPPQVDQLKDKLSKLQTPISWATVLMAMYATDTDKPVVGLDDQAGLLRAMAKCLERSNSNPCKEGCDHSDCRDEIEKEYASLMRTLYRSLAPRVPIGAAAPAEPKAADAAEPEAAVAADPKAAAADRNGSAASPTLTSRPRQTDQPAQTDDGDPCPCLKYKFGSPQYIRAPCTCAGDHTVMRIKLTEFIATFIHHQDEQGVQALRVIGSLLRSEEGQKQRSNDDDAFFKELNETLNTTVRKFFEIAIKTWVETGSFVYFLEVCGAEWRPVFHLILQRIKLDDVLARELGGLGFRFLVSSDFVPLFPSSAPLTPQRHTELSAADAPMMEEGKTAQELRERIAQLCSRRYRVLRTGSFPEAARDLEDNLEEICQGLRLLSGVRDEVKVYLVCVVSRC